MRLCYQIVATHLGHRYWLPPFWLEYGNDGPARGTAAQPTPTYRVSLSDRELVRHYRLLDDREQQAIAEIITALSGKG